MAAPHVNPQSSADRIQRSIRRHLVFGLCVIVLLFGGAGGWAYVTNISGAVVAPGLLVVNGSQKKIQHPTGGIVSKLLVKDGDHVKADAVLVVLDDTSARAKLAILKTSIDELTVRRARLIAEAAAAQDFQLPADLASRREEPALKTIFDQETALFEAGLNARNGQKSQLAERIKQLEDEIAGTERQAKAKEAEAKVVDDQLASLQKLQAQKLVPTTRVEEATKEAARLLGERGQLQAGLAQTKGRISETRLQILQIDQDYLTEVGKQLRETESKLSEAVERSVEAEDQLRRMEVRAPLDGVVYQLAVHTVGGVVGAGEPMMMIVPESDTLTVEARIAPTDIDQVFVGQHANLRLSAFNQRVTPETSGKVEFVSPDLVTDQHSGSSYYIVRIALAPEGKDKLKLVPGMPCETFIQTGDRSVMSYIVKPLSDQLMRAFREG